MKKFLKQNLYISVPLLILFVYFFVDKYGWSMPLVVWLSMPVMSYVIGLGLHFQLYIVITYFKKTFKEL